MEAGDSGQSRLKGPAALHNLFRNINLQLLNVI